MASLTGNLVKDTYKALLKTSDNDILTASEKQITDGLGTGSGVFIDNQGFFRASKFIVTSGLSSQFLKADGSLDSSAYITLGSLLTGFTPISGSVSASDSILSAIEKIWYNISTGGGGGGGYVPYTGATQDLDLGTYGLIADFVEFNQTPDNLPTTSGSLYYNDADETLNLVGIGGIVQQIGQEIYYPKCSNQTGVTIPNGTLVMVNPTQIVQGDKLSIQKAITDGTYSADLILGIATDDIVNNGMVTWFGYVRDIDTTNINLGGETWAVGNILYGDPNNAGGLTNVEPTAPNHKSKIAVITKLDAGGIATLMVRPTLGQHLYELHDVNISTIANNQGLIWDATDSRWENRNIINTTNYLPKSTGSAFTDSLITDNGTKVTIDGIDLWTGAGNGVNNIGLGLSSLASNTTGDFNVGIGNSALYDNTTGNYNVAIGNRPFWTHTTGDYNVAIGYVAGAYHNTGYNTISNNSIYIGALTQASTSGNTNEIVLGYSAIGNGSNTATYGNSSITNHYFPAGVLNVSSYAVIDGIRFWNGAGTGTNNIGIGNNSLINLTTGSQNMAFGNNSLYQLTTGIANIGIGFASLTNNTSGNHNIGLGSGAISNNTTGSSNIGLGTSAISNNTTGSNNVGIGNYTLYYTTGNSNIGIGSNALYYNTTSNSNIAIGGSSLFDNTTGSANVGLGVGSLGDNTTGEFNVALGHATYGNNITGSYNVAVGYNAGSYNADNSYHTSGNYGLYLGYNTKASATGTSNEIVIGYNAIGNGSNTATYGNSSIASHIFTAGNVGIGVVPTTYKLDVNGTGRFTNTIHVSQNNYTFPAISPSYFGYSPSYNVVILGNSNSAQTRSLAFNVDVSGNPSGAFAGYGNEYIWRNAGSFITPNSSNNGYNTLFSWNNSGQMTFNNSATFSSNVGIGVVPSGYKLDVNGTGRFSGNLYVSNSTDCYPEFITSPSDADVLLGFSNTGDANSGWGIGRRNTGEFWIANYTGNFNNGTRTVPFQIASSGAATFSSSVTAGGVIIGGGGASPTGNLIGNIRSYGGSGAYVSASNELGHTAFFGADSSGYTMFGSLTNHDVVFRSNNNERMRITSGGLVEVNSAHNSALSFRVYYDMEVYNTINFTDASYYNQSSIYGANAGLYFRVNNSNTTAMNIAYSGNVTINEKLGIGTSPIYSIDVYGSNTARFKSSGAYNTVISDNSNVNGGGGFGVYQNGTFAGGIGASGWWEGNSTNDVAVSADSGRNIRFYTNASATERMRITSGGDVTINSLGTGTVYSSSGTLTNTNPSDLRLKTNINPISYGLNEILQLNPITYHWKTDSIMQGKQYGFIAQEVQSIMPDLVKDLGISDYLGLDKEAIFTILVKAIQELKAELDALKN